MLNPSIMLMSMHIESKIAPRVADRSGYVPWNIGVLEGGLTWLNNRLSQHSILLSGYS